MGTKLQERLAPLKGKWAKVAALAGVNPMTVYRIANGAEFDHRIGTFQRISAAIDLVAMEEEAQKKVGAGETVAS